ncbi:MAG TPA: DUF2726 domain-containing protein [Symbiobacteriaceae bacterium]|nr:DUF2726 domain-containing protein [Symbiobacteriaceae bacterium]
MANQGCLGFLFNLFGIAGPAAPNSLPYRTRESLLTPGEQPFYPVLRLAVGSSYQICPKVRLADLFAVKPYNQAYQNKLLPMHIDFLLCDPVTLRPVAGVELDDRSHERNDAQRRDRFKDNLFESAGLPLIRIPNRRSYDPHEIRETLLQRIGHRVTYEAVAPRQKATSGPVAPTPIVGGRKPLK